MSEQLTLHQSFEAQNRGFERLQRQRQYRGLKVWSMIYRRLQSRLKARDKVAQQELMQLEHEIKAGSIDKALARVHHIKGLLACVCLGLCSFQVFDDGFDQRRGARRGDVRVIRVLRVRGKDLEVAA